MFMDSDYKSILRELDLDLEEAVGQFPQGLAAEIEPFNQGGERPE